MNSIENNLFKVQPEFCRKPLPKKDIIYTDWLQETHPETVRVRNRVLSFDPTELYDRIHHIINPFERIQGMRMDKYFPNDGKKCGCGCGKIPKGRRTRWATEECSRFAYHVCAIICNTHQYPGIYITLYYGYECIECKTTDNLQLDHIFPVKKGGAGGWLSNYQYLCHTCHVSKTNKDFNRKEFKEELQLRLF